MRKTVTCLFLIFPVVKLLYTIHDNEQSIHLVLKVESNSSSYSCECHWGVRQWQWLEKLELHDKALEYLIFILYIYYACSADVMLSTLYVSSNKQILLTVNKQLHNTHTIMWYKEHINACIAIGMYAFKVHKNHMTFVNANISTLTAMYTTNTSKQQTMVGIYTCTYC